MNKTDRLLSIPEKFINELYKIQDDIFKEAVRYIKSLDVVDGEIIWNRKNINILASFNEWYDAVIEKSGFNEKLKKFLSEFDKQALITADYFRKEFGNVIISSLTEEIIKIKKQQTAELFISTIIDGEFKQVIKNEITDSVLGRSTFSDTLDRLQNIITGDKRLDGKLVQYSKQVAFDTFAVADRTYTHAISEAIGAEWFKYSGNVREGTRPFCEERFNKFFHKKEIEAWADLKWQGKHDNTNKESIFYFAGGYNCKHSILPVSILSVPDEVINRNIRNKNYKK